MGAVESTTTQRFDQAAAHGVAGHRWDLVKFERLVNADGEVTREQLLQANKELDIAAAVDFAQDMRDAGHYKKWECNEGWADVLSYPERCHGLSFEDGYLKVIDLPLNKIGGQIPASVNACTTLVRLCLIQNHMHG
jgi:hypothetical protein